MDIASAGIRMMADMLIPVVAGWAGARGLLPYRHFDLIMRGRSFDVSVTYLCGIDRQQVGELDNLAYGIPLPYRLRAKLEHRGSTCHVTFYSSLEMTLEGKFAARRVLGLAALPIFDRSVQHVLDDVADHTRLPLRSPLRIGRRALLELCGLWRLPVAHLIIIHLRHLPAAA